MSGPLKRWTMLSMAALSVGYVTGCDDASVGDKTTLTKVDAAVAQLVPLNSLEPGDGVQTVTSGLTQAADGTAGPAYKAVAAGAVASVDEQSAYAGILKLHKQQSAIRRTLTQLQGLAGLVTTSNAYAVGYGLGDPKGAISDLSSHISSMQGNATNLTWGTGEKPSEPTLAAVKQESSRLDGEIEQKQQQLDGLTKQRTELSATAEVQAKHADGLKGEEGVRAFAEASESRRKAEDLGVNIDLVQVQLDRLKSDLELTKAQGGIVTTGVAALQEQGKALESDWISQQKFAAQQKQVATLTTAGDKQGDYSIKLVSENLSKQLSELQQTRSAVLQQLEEARKDADTAYQQSTQFVQSIQKELSLPGKGSESYKNLKLTVHPQLYQYRLGVVQRNTGALSASEASLLTDVKATTDAAKAALTTAGVAVPEELEKIDTAAADQLAKDAEAKISDSEATLINVESGDSPEKLKTAAKLARLVALQAHLQLYASSTDTSTAGKATELKSTAIALRDELIATNTPLPPLPGELGQVPPPAAPATAPAAAPAATPSSTAEPATTPPADPATPPAAAPAAPAAQ